MGNIFTGSEIIELGVQIEKNGKDFYNTLLEKSESQKAKEIFQYLAGEEDKHIAVFQKMLESAEKYEAPESYPGEHLAYVNTLAGEYVFTRKDKGGEVAKGISSDKEAVEVGIGFEKDSILFFEAMKRVVPEHGHKTIEGLIVQEKSHLKQLVDIKKEL